MILKSLLIFTLIFIYSASNLFAQEIEVVFLDGSLEMKRDSQWEEVYTGDILPSETVIRVGDETIVEISSGSAILTIFTPGTFALGSLLESSRSQGASKNLGGFLENILEEIFARPESATTSVILGVRGDEASKEELMWVDEKEYILKEGRELLDSGKYQEALSFFQKAEAGDYGPDAQEYRFYTSYAYAMLGKKGQALKTLKQLSPESTDLFYDDWVLLKGQLLYESLAYQKALLLFENYLKIYPKGRNAQASHLFSALCHERLGNSTESKKSIKQAVKMDPESKCGRMAQKILDGQH